MSLLLGLLLSLGGVESEIGNHTYSGVTAYENRMADRVFRSARWQVYTLFNQSQETWVRPMKASFVLSSASTGEILKEEDGTLNLGDIMRAFAKHRLLHFTFTPTKEAAIMQYTLEAYCRMLLGM